MKRISVFSVVLSVAVAAWALSLSQAPQAEAQQSNAPYVSLSPWQAKELIESKKGLQLVDVRTEREYKSGALPGSSLVPYNGWFKADFMKRMEKFDKSRPILLVCAVGGRSSEAAFMLSRAGFAEVYNLSGGLSAWASQRVPLPDKTPRSAQ